MSKEIKLTQGQVATVCDCHAHLVEPHKWYAHWNPHKKQFVAGRRASVIEKLTGARNSIYMHAVVNGTPKGMETDHVDNNSLNNRCSNLRTATEAQNQRNRGKNKNNSSGYKGVFLHGNRWQALIQLNGKLIYLGLFDSPEKAHAAYVKAAKELHGEFSRGE